MPAKAKRTLPSFPSARIAACAASGASPLPTITSVSPSSAIFSAAFPIESTARAITPSGAFSQPRKSGPSSMLVRSCICASNRSFSPDSRSGRLTLPQILDNSTSIIVCASFIFCTLYYTLGKNAKRIEKCRFSIRRLGLAGGFAEVPAPKAPPPPAENRAVKTSES